MPKERKYKVKEIFATVQGEGFHTGTPAIFVRLTGCNYWNGNPDKKAKSLCEFCDTDFVGTDGTNGGSYTALEIAKVCRRLAPNVTMIVLTGGEPTLQTDDALISTLKLYQYYIAIETNGSGIIPKGVDWICISPKSIARLRTNKADELKVLYPSNTEPNVYAHFINAEHHYVQPKDDEYFEQNVKDTLAYVLANTRWKLSTQTHKALNIE